MFGLLLSFLHCHNCIVFLKENVFVYAIVIYLCNNIENKYCDTIFKCFLL